MASAEALEDDRDTSLPASALSPAEYRSFRAFLLDLHHAAGSPDRHAPLFAVLEFLVSFNGVNLSVAQQIVDCVLGRAEEYDVIADGQVYAMIRLIGHWQSEGRIERSMIFVQSRVPDRISSPKATTEPPHQSITPLPSTAPSLPTLNPFRANSTPPSSSSSSSIARTQATDKGIEAFKRLIFSSNSHSEKSPTTANDITEAPTIQTIPSSAKTEDSLLSATLDESPSLRSLRTAADHSTTGVTFVYSSDDQEDDDLPPSIKHSPETDQLRESPSPVTPLGDRRSLPPLQTQLSPHKPTPPPSRKRGASGGNQSKPSIITLDDKTKTEDRTPARRNLPPLPPVPRRTLSSASTSHHSNLPERSGSLRRDPGPPTHSAPEKEKPPIPRPRRKLSDTSVTSVDPTPASRTSFEAVVPENNSVAVPTASKRLSTQAPPPPPPPRGGRKMTAESSGRRSIEIPVKRSSIERPESPRRFSVEDEERSAAGAVYEDSELSLELGKLQREVDELVYGLTKKRGGHVAGVGSRAPSAK